MRKIYIKSSAICCPNAEVLTQFELDGSDVDKTLIPAVMRRRTSLTSKMAITAATHACEKANVNPEKLPSVFASLGGEIQVTDALCRLLPDKDELLSPTQFHNSVHNTTAGYWGILNHCQKPATAIAAVDDGFAMGLLESWSQLQQTSGDLLLVCYDELWPQYLAAPIGKIAFACALVLSTEVDNALAIISVPEIKPVEKSLNKDWCDLVNSAPATAAVPLLQALKQQESGLIPLNINAAIWHTYLQN
ncbi:MAG: hypothetical protein GQ569_15085 [Methylococcaceae bacterium]|nr:hypothetical protein [Methylococcaceae bacterium]